MRDWLRSWPALALKGGASVVHVDDVAAGIVAALDRGVVGERYILGGENLTVADMARRCLREAGMRKPVVVLPERVVRAAVRVAGALRLPAPMPAEVVGYACRYWFMDSTKAQAELGFTPRPTEETIREVVRWIQEQKANGAAAPGRREHMTPETRARTPRRRTSERSRSATTSPSGRCRPATT